MTLYDELGVKASATPNEVRDAYLTKARKFHPDVAGERGADEMRRLNDAWAVLRNAESRAKYDRELERRTKKEPPRERVKPQHEPFRPHSAYETYQEDEGNNDWRYEPDEGDPATAPGKVLQMLPTILLVSGLMLGVFGLLIRVGPLVAMGIGVIIAAGISFVFVPLVAMTKAASTERQNR